MISSKATSAEWASGSFVDVRRCLPCLSDFFAGTAPSLSALLGFSFAGAVPSGATSATRYDLPKWIFGAASVVAELKLADIQRQIGFADLVEVADDTALDERPEAFDRLCVDRPHNVLLVCMPDDFVRILAIEAAIAYPFVTNEQCDLVGNDFADEAFESGGVDAFNHAGNDLSLAADRADNRLLAGTKAAATRATALANVAILRLAADEGLVNLYLAEQLALGTVLHGDADAVAHIPSRLIGASADHSMDLVCRHALFRVVHQEGDLEPLDQRIFRVLEDRSGDDREPIAVLVAGFTEPVERAGFDHPHFGITAARAMDAIRPTTLNKVCLAGIFAIEAGNKIAKLHHEQDYSS